MHRSHHRASYGSSPIPSLPHSSPLLHPSSCSSLEGAPGLFIPAHKRDYRTDFRSILHFTKHLALRTKDLSLSNIDIESYQQLVHFLEDPRKVGGVIADSIRFAPTSAYSRGFLGTDRKSLKIQLQRVSTSFYGKVHASHCPRCRHSLLLPRAV